MIWVPRCRVGRFRRPCRGHVHVHVHAVVTVFSVPRPSISSHLRRRFFLSSTVRGTRGSSLSTTCCVGLCSHFVRLQRSLGGFRMDFESSASGSFCVSTSTGIVGGSSKSEAGWVGGSAWSVGGCRGIGSVVASTAARANSTVVRYR